MARPLRIDLVDGLYHVTARGNERRSIDREDRDRQHFVELLEEVVERYGIRLHAYVLLDNHYHLLVRTPQANLSAAMQWLGQRYAMWFNRRHRRAGHLFQGRFHAVVLEEGAVWEVAGDVHVNPVRVKRLGLDKASQKRSRAGMGSAPAAAVVTERIRRLRRYRWSSYRSCIGLEEGPSWLDERRVLAMGGAKTWEERHRRYQQECEQAIREGLPESPWDRLEAGVVLGGERFLKQVRRQVRRASKEQPRKRQLEGRPGFEAAVRVVEGLTGEPWVEFRDRYGDWGRDLALHLGQRVCGLTLAGLGKRLGGAAYKTVATAIRRLKQRIGSEKKLAALAQQAEQQLKNGET